jgi:hypothetical protein
MLSKEQVNNLETADDEKLRSILFESSIVLESVILSNPDYSEDTGYEPFGNEWIKRYFKSILSEVSGKTTDDALSWALAASLYDIANKVIGHYSISVTDYPGAIALAILLVRASLRVSQR